MFGNLMRKILSELSKFIRILPIKKYAIHYVASLDCVYITCNQSQLRCSTCNHITITYVAIAIHIYVRTYVHANIHTS